MTSTKAILGLGTVLFVVAFFVLALSSALAGLLFLLSIGVIIYSPIHYLRRLRRSTALPTLEVEEAPSVQMIASASADSSLAVPVSSGEGLGEPSATSFRILSDDIERPSFVGRWIRKTRKTVFELGGERFVLTTSYKLITSGWGKQTAEYFTTIVRDTEDQKTVGLDRPIYFREYGGTQGSTLETMAQMELAHTEHEKLLEALSWGRLAFDGNQFRGEYIQETRAREILESGWVWSREVMKELAERLNRVFPGLVRIREDLGHIIVMEKIRVTGQGVVEGTGLAADRVKAIYEEMGS